jgi:hypothetical protein
LPRLLIELHKETLFFANMKLRNYESSKMQLI